MKGGDDGGQGFRIEVEGVDLEKNERLLGIVGIFQYQKRFGSSSVMLVLWNVMVGRVFVSRKEES